MSNDKQVELIELNRQLKEIDDLQTSIRHLYTLYFNQKYYSLMDHCSIIKMNLTEMKKIVNKNKECCLGNHLTIIK